MMSQDATTLPEALPVQVPAPRDGRQENLSPAPRVPEQRVPEQETIGEPAEPEMTDAERERLRGLVERRLGGRGLSGFLEDLDRMESELMESHGQDWR